MAEHDDDRRRLEEQRNNLQLLNEVVRHDIRNKLQVIQAYAELLEDHVDGEAAEYLETIQENTENAVTLTTTARELTQVMLEPDRSTRPVRLSNVLNAQLEEMRSAHSGAVLTVEGSIPPVTVGGGDMLASVFRNLLQNAIQHNDKTPPEVRISVTVSEDHARVRVADNGPGVPDAQKETIFGKGEKGLDSPGTGIGLYLVQSLVDGYGGDVWVEDNDPEGAVFVVELPRVDVD